MEQLELFPEYGTKNKNLIQEIDDQEKIKQYDKLWKELDLLSLPRFTYNNNPKERRLLTLTERVGYMMGLWL